MYLLPLLILVESAFHVAFVNGAGSAEQYLLPKNIRPNLYDVQLFLNPELSINLAGEVSIQASVHTGTNEIVMHAMDLEIETGAIRVVRDAVPNDNLVSNFTLETDDTHLLRIRLNRDLQAEESVTINIKYKPEYSTNMLGIYVSTYRFENRTRRLVTSQLQPTYARRVFPCFDEPSFKAIFRTTIYAPSGYPVVRSNMPRRQVSIKDDIRRWEKYEFEDTPIMPTYLNGYLVSNFDHVGNTLPESNEPQNFRAPVNVYSRVDLQSAEFGLDFGVKSVVSLKNYTDIDYVLPKLDKVAIPDKVVDTAANWGLSTFREVNLLVSDGVTTAAIKQNVAKTITHANINLWIGNEVTPTSWQYLWLTEGFANFFEYFGTDFVQPGWRMNDQFVLEMQNVFQYDALINVNPLTNPVYTPEEILGNFNAVAHQKAGSIIRMLQHVLTPPVFKLALHHYIKTMSAVKEAASPRDLYVEIERVLTISNHSIGHAVDSIMDSWVNQGGFPVVTVRRTTTNDFVVNSDRYLTSGPTNIPGRWYIPLSWTTGLSPDFSDTRTKIWVTPGTTDLSVNINGLSENDWFIFNVQQTGYYRVNYDEDSWKSLTNVLLNRHTIIHEVNRASLLDDAFNLARSRRMNYTVTLDLSLYLTNETDYIPWGAAQSSFNYLDTMLHESQAYHYFQNYIRNITEPLYNRLGFSASSGEEYLTPFLRNTILDLNCRHSNTNCTSAAGTLMWNFRENPEGQRIHPDIQYLVYCTVLRGGDPDPFFFLWNYYQASTDVSERAVILNALGCTTNTIWRSFFLSQSTLRITEVRDHDRHNVIISVINSSPSNTNVALDFVVSNFQVIISRIQPVTGTTEIFNAFAKKLTTQAHLDRVDELVRRHQSVLTVGDMAAIEVIRDNIRTSIAWREQNAATVEAWLEENYGDGAMAHFSSSLILLISLFVTIFNR